MEKKQKSVVTSKKLSFDEIIHEFEFGGQKCSLSCGKFARRSNSAVWGRMGDTIVLATVDIADPQPGMDYFPLNVEYVEKMYAGGKISSSRFIKREGFPSDEAVLSGRMIDRAIRNRFPSDYFNCVQVVITILSYDPAADPLIIGFNAVSAALMLSGAPFEGPIAGLRVGYDGEKHLIYNKSVSEDVDAEEKDTDLNLVIGTDGELVTMIDAGANQLADDLVYQGLEFAVENSASLIEAQSEFIKKVEAVHGKAFKAPYEGIAAPKELISEIRKNYKGDIEKNLELSVMSDKEDAQDELKDRLNKEYEGKFSKVQIGMAVAYVTKEVVQHWILEDKKRSDGRKIDEIRPLNMEVGIIPRAHGSALFTRGMTQALTITTLGSARLVQLVDNMEGEATRRYMHHYNAPDYSTGSAGKFNYRPGRREIGHGALAEKALAYVIPDMNKFPYTIRVVSDILSMAGSSSMASVCGSSLSLMDAGVPISAPVAGVAMGLVISDDLKDFVVLTDLAEYEDFYGHMDFKVAGTREGVTAVQMDNKKHGLPLAVFKQGFVQAKDARLFLLDEMTKVISEPRLHLSKYAPKIDVITIPVAKIGELIGPGGKVIKGIIEDTGAEIDISQDGKVSIASINEESRKRAIEAVKGLTEEAEVGKVYHGKVAKIMEFGAFVDVSPSISGLVHVSEMSDKFVKDPHEIVKEGQDVDVKVIGIDERGRVKLSMKQVKKQ